jgi:hypothetical protein
MNPARRFTPLTTGGKSARSGVSQHQFPDLILTRGGGRKGRPYGPEGAISICQMSPSSDVRTR